jgi:hypothetical protein
MDGIGTFERSLYAEGAEVVYPRKKSTSHLRNSAHAVEVHFEVIGSLALRYCNPGEDAKSVDNGDFVHV